MLKILTTKIIQLIIQLNLSKLIFLQRRVPHFLRTCYYSHLFNVVFVSFTARVHSCCEWELTVAWLYIKPTLVPIDEFFIWRDVVHRLVDLIGYSTITSFHSSIYLVLLSLWTTIIFLYDHNSYSTPYILR